MMKPPTNYAEWVRGLDLLKAGEHDETTLQAMEAGRLEWQIGVADRFTDALATVLNARLKRLSDTLQRDLNHSRMEEAGIVRALQAARREFAILMRLTNLPALPAEVRSSLTDLVRKYAERAQSSLEATAQADRTGRLFSLLRKSPLTGAAAETTPTPPTPPAGTGRRIILQ